MIKKGEGDGFSVPFSNRANAALYSSGAKPYQKFKLKRYSSDTFRLDFPGIGYSIDCSSTNLYIFSTHTESNQHFIFIPVTAYDSAGKTSMTSSATYTANGEYTDTMTDNRGNVTNYDYNEDRGLLTKVTSPNGAVTDYTYDASEMLSSVTVANSANTLTQRITKTE